MVRELLSWSEWNEAALPPFPRVARASPGTPIRKRPSELQESPATQPLRRRSHRIITRRISMNGIVYLVGLIVIVMFILSVVGLR